MSVRQWAETLLRKEDKMKSESEKKDVIYTCCPVSVNGTKIDKLAFNLDGARDDMLQHIISEVTNHYYGFLVDAVTSFVNNPSVKFSQGSTGITFYHSDQSIVLYFQ